MATIISGWVLGASVEERLSQRGTLSRVVIKEKSGERWEIKEKMSFVVVTITENNRFEKNVSRLHLVRERK